MLVIIKFNYKMHGTFNIKYVKFDKTHGVPNQVFFFLASVSSELLHFLHKLETADSSIM
jgi:hypothetical protein